MRISPSPLVDLAPRGQSPPGISRAAILIPGVDPAIFRVPSQGGTLDPLSPTLIEDKTSRGFLAARLDRTILQPKAAIIISKKGHQKKGRGPSPREPLSEAKRLCHLRHGRECVEMKRSGLFKEFLKRRLHWSESKREEQHRTIDRGETEPFDIAIPLPARDRDDPEGTSWGTDLFWERFRCIRCGRCCYSPGAGLYIDGEDMDRICSYLGWPAERLEALCIRDRNAEVRALRQPCPFYDPEEGCTIYPARPKTCTRYPLHPPLQEMPYHLAVDAFCPAAREFVKETLGWWIVCEANWARILKRMEEEGSEEGGMR